MANSEKIHKNNETGNTKKERSVRPTKKQFETLDFIRHFIAEHGYSPSYREIMNGCNYTSVATVSLHVNNLIKRGHIVKRDKSARSLEVVSGVEEKSNASSNHKHELIKEIEARFTELEKEMQEEVLNEVYVLVGALKILGHQDVARAYAGRITEIQS
jgi:SOS-response transcriptional repressor LexA